MFFFKGLLESKLRSCPKDQPGSGHLQPTAKASQASLSWASLQVAFRSVTNGWGLVLSSL